MLHETRFVGKSRAGERHSRALPLWSEGVNLLFGGRDLRHDTVKKK